MSQDKPVLTAQRVKDFYFCHARKFEGGGLELFQMVRDLALRAIERQGSGKWVPLKPSIMLLDKMIEAWFDHPTGGGRDNFINRMQAAYDAMLAAAPQAQDAQTGEEQSLKQQLYQAQWCDCPVGICRTEALPHRRCKNARAQTSLRPPAGRV